MQTSELITELRDWAEVQGPGSLGNILNEAADTIESMDERIDIVSESIGIAERRFDEHLREIGVRES